MRPARSARWSAWRVGTWLMLAPYLVGLLLLVALPALMSAVLAFTSYDALSPPTFTGLANFRAIAADPLTAVALANSLVFIALAVPLRLLAALGLALLLSGRRRGVGAARAAVYLPSVVPDVAFALVWLWILNPLHGPVNTMLAVLGLPTPAWLTDASTARYPFVAMSLLQVGEGFVILLAALRSVPRDTLDAGAVDGAGGLASFRFLTLPFLVPWLLLLTFRDVIVAFQWTFVPTFVMTGGDPYHATLTLPLLIYEEAFDRFRFGQGSALMLLMFLATALIIGMLFLLLRRRGLVADA